MDPSCGDIANVMSCDAQIQLAKREVQDNTYISDYMVNYPACSRMNTLMDRDTESAFWMSIGSAKRMCLPKMPHDDGVWARQFQTLTGEASQESYTPTPYTKFDQWTRARNRDQPLGCQ